MDYFTPIQKDVMLNANKRWNILTGAVRSGKTFASIHLVPQRIKEHSKHNVLFAGKTLNTLDRNVFDLMRQTFGDKAISKIYDKKEIDIFGKRCYCVGANDDRAITKIQGVGLGYAYCDELTTFPENFFNMLKSRLDQANSKCDATCNPEQPSHFVKSHIDNKTLDTYTKHFTLYDNPRLDPAFVRNLENEYRGTIYFDKWILGKWVRSEGLVFPLFKRDRHYLSTADFTKKYGNHFIRYVIWGGDGATTNDATAIIPLAILDNGMACVLPIFYHDPKENGQLSNELLTPYIQHYLRDMQDKYRFEENGVEMYMPIDSAAADLVLSLRYNLDENYNVRKYTKKDLMQTTDTVNNALGRNVIYILSSPEGAYYNYIKGRWEGGTHPLVIDLESMIWEEGNKKFDNDIPNDCGDAFRYAVCTYYYNPENLWETPKNTYFEELK